MSWQERWKGFVKRGPDAVGGGFRARYQHEGVCRANSNTRGVLGRDSDTAESCRADSGRSGFLGRLSDITNVFGQELDAQEPPNVQISPDNKFIVQMSPENEAVSESRLKRRRRRDIAPANTHSVRISPENARPRKDAPRGPALPTLHEAKRLQRGGNAVIPHGIGHVIRARADGRQRVTHGHGHINSGKHGKGSIACMFIVNRAHRSSVFASSALRVAR